MKRACKIVTHKRIINRLNICLALILFFAAGCKVADIPIAYQIKSSEVKTNPYGSWTKVAARDTSGSPYQGYENTGELIAIDNNTIYLLVDHGKVKTISLNSVNYMELYTHKNQSNKYLTTTGILLIPQLIGALVHGGEGYAGGFLMLGIPVSVIGAFSALREDTKKNNVLVYPGKNSIKDLKKFARFPDKIPPGLNYGELTLKH